ncbi:PREDICTED: PCI domain-containing protein 2 [Nicrophorus vespilloides]|uniref:CSN12-like protein n=1 Tax=Nicrophorus vespilloides TaxID=110193 RepID=A0ABM1M2F7_NICVS|nr:PREDICTED: PCI domain-containing protein 2 [Nicrophorus vespilloides]
MTIMSLAHYLQMLERCWHQQDGLKIAALLSLRYDQAANLAQENPTGMVMRFVKPPLDELVIAHLKCMHYLLMGSFTYAYKQQSVLVQNLTKIIQTQKEENWFLPVMYTTCLDLRILAQGAEKEQMSVNNKPGEILEKAAECLMGCFRVCAADNRSSEESTKRIGMLNLVNQLFKVYSKINKLHLCKPLIRAIESSPFKESFSLSQQITYRYYVGRKAMFDSDYNAANEYLTYAFENCHKDSRKNKRLILFYLVPVKMLLGYMPSRKVLEKYDVQQFWDLVQAVSQGNLKLFDELMEKHEQFFIKCGIYLIVDKLKIIAYRNLFRKVYLILNTHQIPVDALQTALVSLGQTDVDTDETECIVANLIYEGKIKGYISHQHRKVVVSKQNPFPSLTSLT